MSETPSGNPLEQTIDHTRLIGAATNVPQALGYVLYERVGVGGMGEVYRCGDDSLQRDLAVKVIKRELHGDADAEERFLREARLTGSLQHPGIVPIHQLGRLADGRPYYTMKLIRGRTFADMLRDEPLGPERLPRLLAVVEKVAQAVAYAHSRGVIHRDLKPSNVMVGEFGEVQVMDWGLAKELSRIESVAPTVATEDAETLRQVEAAEGVSRAGAALGTPNYMPPEQAAGDWEIVDERADVFALGAILCQVLTGRPPYHGDDREYLLRRARLGDTAEALQRLQQCGADADLVRLVGTCLTADLRQRPRHAGAVAEQLAAYQAEVRERLRHAELQRARAEVQAREERKRRRLTLGVAALLLLVGLGIGGGVWWLQRQREKADLAVSNGLAQAELLAQQARADPLQTDKYHPALEAARVAKQLAESATADARRRAEELIARLQAEEQTANKDRELLTALLDVRGPREGPKYQSDSKGTMLAVTEPTADEQFAAAFRRWGLDVDGTPPAEAAAKLQARPALVVTGVIAALDEWTSERDRLGKSRQHLTEVAMLLDKEPGSKRRELREILSRRRLPLERALSAIAMALRPVPLPMEAMPGRDRLRLRQLAEQTDAAAEPILGLLTLVRALGIAGEEERAERLLRESIAARPREVVLHHTLGQLLTASRPPRWAEAVECYAAARVLRPDLGARLAEALLRSGRDGEGLVLLARRVKESPTNPFLHSQYAYHLQEKGRLDEAIEEMRQAIALDSKVALVHFNLGVVLRAKGRLEEALREFRQAVALDPKWASAHANLGLLLRANGKLKEAIDEYRHALALNPNDALAHSNLGVALRAQGRIDEAMVEYRHAIALDPTDAMPHYNLGIVLQDKGRLEEAMAEYREAIRLRPDYARAHCNLGFVLRQCGRFAESLSCYRRGHEWGSKESDWRYPSAQWVRDAERLVELAKKLPAVLQGQASPADASEAAALAEMCCQPYQQRYADSARLYADAFVAEPKLVSDLNRQHRYNAACSAALAASEKGKGSHFLPDKVAMMFRTWAWAWLREDLTAYTPLVESAKPAVREILRQRLTFWQRDPDLASVRDPQALNHLPEQERIAWQALWREVDDLAKRAAKKND